MSIPLRSIEISQRGVTIFYANLLDENLILPRTDDFCLPFSTSNSGSVRVMHHVRARNTTKSGHHFADPAFFAKCIPLKLFDIRASKN